MLSYEAFSSAPPPAAWFLIARPDAWSKWAPHVRGAWGLGDPEVRVGARGAARLAGIVPVPAMVTSKRPGESWTWKVGPVQLVHRVSERPGGCVVGVDIVAPAPVERMLSVTYGPLVALLVTRLARVAERSGYGV